MKGNKLVVICGPTATGKSALAVEIAKAFRLVDEMNEEELGRQMKKYLRMVKRTRKEIEAGEDSGSTINTGSARERALASLSGKKKKRKKGDESEAVTIKGRRKAAAKAAIAKQVQFKKKRQGFLESLFGGLFKRK